MTRTITFDGTNPNTSQAFVHGDIIAQGIAAPGAVIDTYNSGTVRMRVNNVAADHNNSVYDLAVIFNSNATSTEDNDLVFGNNSVNRIAPISAAALTNNAYDSLDSVEFYFKGSGAIDNVTDVVNDEIIPPPVTSVPEPSTFALFVAAVIAFGVRRRKLTQKA